MCRPGTWRLSAPRENTKLRAGRGHLQLSHPVCRWLLILIVALQAVDIAIASVMRDALLRRGEAAYLRWGDVEFRPDGSSRVTIRRSKTSNRSVVLFVGVRATAALNRTRPCNPIPDGRVFGVRRGRTISTRIVTMCREAGLGEGFSGHSPRVGMTQDLVAHGAGLVAIMNAGRWKSERMPAHYSRGEAAGLGAVARYYAGKR